MGQFGEIEIRPMSRAELDGAVEWAAIEGWNPGLYDADCFYRTDPEGFLGAFQKGEPLASISVVRYPGGFAFLGFYIVRPEFRGLGHGFRLWQAGMDRVEGCTVGLDGVVAQQANYEKSGFVMAHRNVRYGGDVRVEAPSDTRVTSVAGDLIASVIDYDRAFFPAQRETFLECWLHPTSRKSFVLIEDGTVRGYGVIRECRTGHKVGPLFADNERNADILFRALASTVQKGPVFLDVPESNGKAIELAIRHGLAPHFETARTSTA